ncbi:MAG: Gfo/Idh/MocA family oxidoreductase [Ostreibacterium sp.]
MINIGIVGLGRLGKRHAENLTRRIDGVRLIAAASPVEEERRYALETLNLPHVVARLDTLLNIDEVDAVVLVTPTILHAEQSIQVLQTGKHLFIEKPLALNVADCKQVEAVYADTTKTNPKQIAMVGFVRRFDPSYAAAKQSILNNEIGSPFFVRSQTCDQYDSNGFFVQFSATSGGLIMDCNIHDIDLVRWFLSDKNGKCPKATGFHAVGSNNIHPDLAQFEDVDNVVTTIEFEGGKFAHLYASRTFAHGHETSTEIIADKGKLLVGAGAHLNRVVKSDAYGVSHATLPDFTARFNDAFIYELQAFSDACNGKIKVPLSLNDATEATRIGVELTKALRKNIQF